MTTLVWFRQDLRLADNPALAAAAGKGPVIPVYLFAPIEEGAWPPGGASRWWLHHSLLRLQEELSACGSRLCLRGTDDSLQALQQLAAETGATRIVWNRRYEPAAILRDAKIKSGLVKAGLQADSHNAALLREPWAVKTKNGSPFQVFTPFWRHCLALEEPPEPAPAPRSLQAPARWPKTQRLESLALLPEPDWAGGMRDSWTPGSAGAQVSLHRFLKENFDEYGTLRDRPAEHGTSRLSPHLHFGEIGPRQIWHAVRRFALERGRHSTWRDSTFLAELGWREFAYHLLYHFPHTSEQPLREKFSRFAWNTNSAGLVAWQRGRTGYPIVDAGMRQLWHTGWMHNRVRMIAASFLVKDLLLSWTEGARWFWDTLVDADLSSNSLGWQWVAGSGADAAPFFRIFNPVMQGTKFDPNGTYVRRWVPELAMIPDAWIHSPWKAPAEVLNTARVKLGRDYPCPLVDHETARKAALQALADTKA